MSCHTSKKPTHNGVVQITRKNIKKLLASNKVVFINFYTDWANVYNKSVIPDLNKASDELLKAGYGSGKVLIGKINCQDERALARTFNICCYPTLKLFRNGSYKERYIGEFSAEAFTEFIKKEFSDPIK